MDSGSHRDAFERSVQLGSESLQKARLEGGDDPSVRFGVGYATYVEPTVPTYFSTTGNWTSHDACTIEIEPDGSVRVTAGISTAGQGLKTMAATVAAEALGVRFDDVSVVLGDTDLCPYGLGGWGSRSTAVATGAILKAAGILKGKILAIAEHVLEAPAEDLVVEGGYVHVIGSEKPAMKLSDVARIAYVRTLDLPRGVDPGLTATATYDPPGLDHRPRDDGRMNGAGAFTNHSHAAVVRVHLETGEIHVVDYIVVHDCGRVLNPPIVEGQVHGGVAQGVGGALYEHMVYNSDGQPLTTTFMDYLVPSALEVPSMLVEHLESPAPEMPLGVKGVGEGGTIGPLGAIPNAIAAALSEFGVDITATPVTPASLRQLLRKAMRNRQ